MIIYTIIGFVVGWIGSTISTNIKYRAYNKALLEFNNEVKSLMKECNTKEGMHDTK